jgi:hypothetical protein
MDEGPGVPDGLGPADPFAGSSAPARPPADFAFLFPHAAPPATDEGKAFCYLCDYPLSVRSNTHARNLTETWDRALEHVPPEAAGATVAAEYDLRVRELLPGAPEWAAKTVAEHFILHCIHPRTQYVMSLHIAARMQHQVAESLESRSPDGRLIPLSVQTVTAIEKVLKTHERLWRGFAASGGSGASRK